MEEGYIKAQADNLPKVDIFMVAQYFSQNSDFVAAEMHGVKLVRSARESYGDDAIGYVQIRRKDGVCTVKCKMCPEHKVRSKIYYNVTIAVNEDLNKIISCQCHDCAAAAGGCLGCFDK